MDQLYLITRQDIYERTAQVSYMRKQTTIIEINHVFLGVYRNCSLNFVPLQRPFGYYNPSKKASSSLTLSCIWILIDSSYDSGISAGY